MVNASGLCVFVLVVYRMFMVCRIEFTCVYTITNITLPKRRVAGYTWTDLHIAKELEITPVLDKLLEYKRNWIQHLNRMPRDRLPRVMKHYSPTGRRNRGRPLKRLLDT